MSDQNETPLRKITSVSILDDSYDLARNGECCHLVEQREPDAYRRPVARKVDLEMWITTERVQALLDLYGDSLDKITMLEEELSRSHAALQREAGPDSVRRSQVSVSRESVTSLPGVLDAEGDAK